MPAEYLYRERLTSARTEALFVALMLLFGLLFAWRCTVAGADALAMACLALAGVFLFYSVNYRLLEICLTPEDLSLNFGIFTWRLPLDNIDACRLDDIPPLMKYGGAGIHFMFVRGRYRASFNFLEYPRVVVALKKPAGPVRDISFSTRQPDQALQLLHHAVTDLKGYPQPQRSCPPSQA